MSLDSLSSLHKAELREIIRTQVRASLQREGQPRKEGESVPELSGEIMSRLDELPADIKEHFLKTWLSSRLPLDPDIILPLFGELQKYESMDLQKQLITAAAFLKREGLPLRRFFLRPLAGLNTPDLNEAAYSWRDEISHDLTLPEPEIISTISELITFGRGSEAAQLLEDLADSMEKLLQELFQLHSESSENGSDSSSTLNPRENQIFSSLVGMRILNLAGNLGEKGSLLLYLEWPPLMLQRGKERLILTVSEREYDKESTGSEGGGKNSFHRISLLVEREKLGCIKTEMEAHRRDLYLSFSVNRREIENRLKQNLPELRHNLSRSDFALQGVSVKWQEDISQSSPAETLLKGDTTPQSEEELEDILKSYKNIDFRA